ncbi:MAG TPA: hypothetical protein VL486_08140 [Verrucomicrobiae bacterium]|nr:hypothetical protein [Verrucomicrobiae bacterium]
MTTSTALPTESLLPVPVPVDPTNTAAPVASTAGVGGEATFAQLIDQGDSGTDTTTGQPAPDAKDGNEKKDDVAAVAQMGLAVAFAPAPVPVVIVLAPDTGSPAPAVAPITGEIAPVAIAAPTDNGGTRADDGKDATANPTIPVPPVPLVELDAPQPSSGEVAPAPVVQQPQVPPPADAKSAAVLVAVPGKGAVPGTVAVAECVAATDTVAVPECVVVPDTSASVAAAVAADDNAAATDSDPDASTDADSIVSTVSAKDAGMQSANVPVPMKTTAKTERNADSAEQNLPRGQIVPDGVSRRAETPAEKSAPDAPVPRSSRTSDTAETPSPAIPVMRAVAAQPTVELSYASAAHTPAVDRLAQAITEQVLSFKRIGTNSLDVSMQPDRNTELSLHITMYNGQVEVMARLERGQFDTLQVHWSELQQTLAQQGVRVGQLTSSSAMGDQSQSQFLQHGFDGHAQHWFEEATEGPEELLASGAPTGPLLQRTNKATPTTHRGWEMWA